MPTIGPPHMAPNDETELDIAELFDRLPIPLYATSREGRVLAANRAFWEIWERPDDQKDATRTDRLYADPTERKRVIEELDRSDLELIDWEQAIETPKGTRWIHPLARVIRDTDGRMTGFEGGFLTVTPVPDAGAVEQQQRILLERTADSVLILDPEGRIIWANSSARRVLGITEATVQGRPPLNEVAGFEVPFQSFAATAPDRGERTFLIKGERRHFWVNLEPHLGSDGTAAFYSLIGTDLALLDDARSRLATSVLQRDEVIGTVAHEIRTPLTSVLGLSEELATRLAATGDAEAAELAALIARESIDMAKIIDDLIDSNANGRSRAAIGTIDLRREALAAARSIEFPAGDFDVEGEALAQGDPAWVRRIVRNLLTNARRYGRPPVSVHLSTEDQEARLRVIDRGPGVPDDLVRSIFEPYVSQGGGPGDTALGLGLTVSKALAQEMEGTLTYARLDGITIFDLTLPAAVS